MASWSSNSHWDAARSRGRVITRSVGVRSANEVALGYDPQEGVMGDATALWHMDNTSGALTEVKNGWNAAASNVSRNQTGPLGGRSVSFNGSSSYATTSAINPFGSGSFSVAAWVNKRPKTGDADMLFRNGTTYGGTNFLQYWTDQRIFFGYFNANGSQQSDSWFHSGTSNTGQHLIVGTYNQSTNTLAVTLNGSRDTHNTSANRPGVTESVNIGRSPIAGNPRHFNGNIGFLAFWNRALTTSEISTLQETLSDGFLNTNWEETTGAALSATIDASVPSSTNATARVRQQTPDGSNDQTISLSGGSNSYSLSGFDYGSGEYAIDFDLSTNSQTQTPVIRSASLSIDAAELTAVDTVPVYSDGEYYDVPLYDTDDLAASDRPIPATIRGVDGDEGAFKLISPSLSNARYRHDGTTFGIELEEGEDGGTGTDPDPDPPDPGDGTLLVDDFESGNLSAYTSASGGSVTSAAAYEGVYGFRGTNMGAYVRSMAGDGLPNYPRAGDTFEFYYRRSATGGTVDIARVDFGTASLNPLNTYRIEWNGDQMTFRRVIDGTVTGLLTFNSTTFPVGTWRRVEVEWGSGGIFTVRAFTTGGSIMQEETLPTAQTQFTSGGVAYWTNATTGLDVDEFRITNRP